MQSGCSPSRSRGRIFSADARGRPGRRPPRPWGAVGSHRASGRDQAGRQLSPTGKALMAEIVNRLFREQVAIGFQNLSAQDIAILKHCIPQNQVLRHAHVGSTERFHVEEPAEICIIGPLPLRQYVSRRVDVAVVVRTARRTVPRPHRQW